MLSTPEPTVATPAPTTDTEAANSHDGEDSGATIRGEARASETPTLRLPELSVADTGSPAFRLESILGEGGMGVVRLATQAGIGRDVAVKHLRPGASPGASQHLLAEASIMGRLEHPVIVPVYAVGLSPELGPIVVMKRIQGSPWSDRLRNWVPSDPDALADQLNILIRVCDGLHFAHEQGVIHRDLKPENVMLGAYGEVYLVDWGVALEYANVSAVEDRQVVGTPAYMAPEMAERELGPLTPRSDVYLLGAILYELLRGGPPHKRKTVLSALIAAAKPLEFTATEGLPRELVSICAKACAYAPKDRYASVAEFQAALRAFLRHQDAARLVDRVLADLDGLESDDVHKETADAVTTRVSALEATLAQALEMAPTSVAAQDGVRRCALLRLRCSLAVESLEEAERLAASLDSLPESLVEVLATLRQARAAQVEAQQQLQAQARRQDVRVGARHRRRTALILFGVVAAVVTGGLIFRPAAALPSMQSTAVTQSIVFAVWLVVLYRGRERFFGTSPNTLFALGCTAVLFGMFIGRWIALAIGVEPTKGAFTELVLFMVVAMQMSQLHRGFWVNFGIALAAMLALLAAPTQVRWIMTGAILTQPIVAWYVWKDLPDADDTTDTTRHDQAGGIRRPLGQSVWNR